LKEPSEMQTPRRGRLEKGEGKEGERRLKAGVPKDIEERGSKKNRSVKTLETPSIGETKGQRKLAHSKKRRSRPSADPREAVKGRKLDLRERSEESIRRMSNRETQGREG